MSATPSPMEERTPPAVEAAEFGFRRIYPALSPLPERGQEEEPDLDALLRAARRRVEP